LKLKLNSTKLLGYGVCASSGIGTELLVRGLWVLKLKPFSFWKSNDCNKICRTDYCISGKMYVPVLNL